MELQKGDKVIITNGIYKDIEGTIVSCSKLGFYLVEPIFKLPAKHFTENELKKNTVIKLWIARDRDGDLKLFSQIPFYDELYESWFALKNDECYGFVGYLDENEIPEVTFENSPQQVELKLINK